MLEIYKLVQKKKRKKKNIDTLTHTHKKQKTLAQGSAGKTKTNMHVQKNTKNKKDNKTSNIDSIGIQNVTTQSINVGDIKISEEKEKKTKKLLIH